MQGFFAWKTYVHGVYSENAGGVASDVLQSMTTAAMQGSAMTS
jgi:hypothetical protein